MPPLLKREITIPGAMLMGLGSIVGTGLFVSIALGTQIAGNAVLIAIVFAAILALFNGLSSAQLAAVHPVSGGTYEYGNHFLNSWFGFTAGWMFMVAKSSSAATAVLGTSAYVFYLLGMETSPMVRMAVGYVLLITMTLLVQGGIRRSDRANRWIVGVTMLGISIFLITAWFRHGFPSTVFADTFSMKGLSIPANSTVQSAITTEPISFASLFYATALMFVAYTGYGRIATLGEEVRNPSVTIPHAILLTMGVVVVLYLAVTSTVLDLVGAPAFAESLKQNVAPLVSASEILGSPWITSAVALSAVTAMAGVLLNLILGLSRVLFSMSRRNDVPAVFQNVHPKTGSPVASVWGSAGVIAALVSTGSVQFTWTFSAVTVLVYYAITNLAALRLKAQERRFPAWISAAGLAGCLFLTVWIDLSVWIPAGMVLVTGWIWHAVSLAKQQVKP